MNNNNAQDQNNEINAIEELNRFLQMILRHWKMIIVSTVLTIIAFAVALFFIISPSYKSTTQLIVNQKTKDSQISDIQQMQSADIQMINTYKSIITSPVISNTVQSNLGSTSGIKNSKVSVDTQANSQVFNINVVSSNANLSSQVANETASVFQRKIKSIMNVNNVTIISNAKVPKKPTSPNKKLGLLAGLAVGIIIGVMLALFKEYTSKTIEDPEFITEDMDLTNLGTINDIYAKQNHKQKYN